MNKGKDVLFFCFFLKIVFSQIWLLHKVVTVYFTWYSDLDKIFFLFNLCVRALKRSATICWLKVKILSGECERKVKRGIWKAGEIWPCKALAFRVVGLWNGSANIADFTNSILCQCFRNSNEDRWTEDWSARKRRQIPISEQLERFRNSDLRRRLADY